MPASANCFSRSLARRLVVLTLACVGCRLGTAGTLDIAFTTDDGAPVSPVKAELLLVAWGTTDRIGIPFEAGSNRVTLPLDEDWLRSRWPDRFADMEKVYLYFEAEGFAPVRFEPFLWIGAHGEPLDPRVESALIALPDGRRVELGEGESAGLDVQFRRPEQRTLRLVDTDGMPVAGVDVRMGMFWSDSNHCGVLAGNDPLGLATSDATGLVQVPDGDIEYAFEFAKQNFVLADDSNKVFGSQRLITRLDTAETIVQLRQLEIRELQLRVTENGVPAAGRALFAQLSNCGCGACSGPLAATDATGYIRIETFVPEQYNELWFEDGNAQRVWVAETAQLDFGGVTDIDLGTQPASAGFAAVIDRALPGFRRAEAADFVRELRETSFVPSATDSVLQADFNLDGADDWVMLVVDDSRSEYRIYFVLTTDNGPGLELLLSRAVTASTADGLIRNAIFLKQPGDPGISGRSYAGIRGEMAREYEAVPAVEIWTGPALADSADRRNLPDSGIAHCSETWYYRLTGELASFDVCD